MTEVIGDRRFYVGTTPLNSVFVVLQEVATPNVPGVEGRYDVNAGDMVDINGWVRSIDDPAVGSTPIPGLMPGQQAVVLAQNLGPTGEGLPNNR